MKSLHVLCALFLAALFFCCESTPASKPLPAPPYTTGGIKSESLVLALRAADKVPDPVRQLALFDRILEIATNAKLDKDASALLAYMSEVLEAHSSAQWFEEYSTALARRYLNLGMAREASDLLKQKLPRISRLENNMRKRLLFEEIIGICLSGGENFLPLLRQTIDAALVLDDPGMKTEILIESASRFLGRGLVKDTQDLLQLTLSQVGGLESPWDQAEIYSRIALVYQGLKNERRAKEYSDRAAREIDAMQVIIRTQEEAAKVGLAAENLLRLGSAETALRVAMTIEYPWILAETLCRMAIYPESKNDRLLDRAYETASAISNNARRLSTLFQLDFLLVDSGRTNEVRGSLPLRDAELTMIPALAVDSYTSRLARLYLSVGDTNAAIKTAARIRDAYSRTGILISAARIQSEKGGENNSLALLEESYALAQNAGQSRDRILQDICGAWLTAGNTRRAVTTAAGISEPYSFATVTADIIRYFLGNNEQPDPESLQTLRNVLTREQRAPK
ncbi:MAG: hypothetical protein LBT68_04345 [Spirochaetales bacterium]|jgi:tetratricopeptide (TPR) repeat protein|nr:hypothetical protein [Spirochaetales bacterium]